MSEFRADLHCHSTCSDGTMTPVELIDHARDNNLQGLVITDHDSVFAYKDALSYARSCAFPIVTGVEFSSTHRTKSVHILGYSFHEKAPSILSLCERHKTRRKARNLAIMEKLKQRNMPIDIEASDETHTMGRPHIAKAMVEKGYVPSIAQAFKRYLGENKLCYVAGESISVEETLFAIHQANGFAIIAHPHLISSSKLIKELLLMPFDGIECYYARFLLKHNEKWLTIAKEKNWLATGGSDFHGATKPESALGSSWVGEEIFSVLQKRYQQNSA